MPLYKGTKLNRELETAIFNKEEGVYDINYPIEIPLTTEAKIALNDPDVLANVSREQKYEGELIIDGIYVSKVDVIVLQVNLQANTVRISILGQYAALANEFGNKKVNQLEMGGYRILSRTATGFDDIDYTFPHIEDGLYDYGELRLSYKSAEINAYMTAIAKGIITDDFLFPKAVDLGGIDGISDAEVIINAWDHDRDRYVDADLYNAMASVWEFIPSTTPANAFTNNQRHAWVPMYKVIRVLEEIFAEANISVEGDILTDAEFGKITLYNTHAINTGVTGLYDTDPGRPTSDNWFTLNCGLAQAYLDPKNHLPDISINDFLRALAKRYNLQYSYDRFSRTLKIKEDRKLVTTPEKVIYLSDFANPKPSINYEKGDSFLNGYEFSFESDSANPANSDDVLDDVADYTYRGDIASFNDIGTIASPVTNDVCFIRNVNSYYKYTSLEGWVLYSHNIAKYKTSAKDNLLQVSTKIVSTPMILQNVEMIDFFASYISVGTVIGTYYTNDVEVVPMSKIGITYDIYNYIDWDNENGILYAPGVGHPWLPHLFQSKKRPVSHLPTVVTYVGEQDGLTGSRKYYMATSGAYDSKGDVLTDIYSGSWTNPGDIGLYKDWWKDLVNMVQDSISTEWQVLIDAATYNELDVNNAVFWIDGLKYLCKKANIVMPFPEIATMQLVKLKI
jgi:hypothetical protein